LYADTIALRSEMPCVSSRDRPWAAPCSDAGPVAVCPVAAGPGAAARAEVEAVLPAPAGPAGERTRNVATMAPAATAPATIPAAAINRRRASRGGRRARQDRARQDRARQDRARQDRARQHRAAPAAGTAGGGRAAGSGARART